MPSFPITFDGPSSQNVTGENLNAANVGFIPTYDLHVQVMTEFVGVGIIQSVAVAQLMMVYLKKAPGAGTPWALTCAVTGFVYTITVCMMGTSSATFNPAVLFAYAILERITWEQFILLLLAQVAGSIAGTLCAYSQFYQYLNRVPIPRKDENGNWIYMEVSPFSYKVGTIPKRAAWKSWISKVFPDSSFFAPFVGGGYWAQTGLLDTDDDVTLWTSSGGDLGGVKVKQDAQPEEYQSKKRSLFRKNKKAEAPDLYTTEEDRLTAESAEFQLELRRDQVNKLKSFAETPLSYSPFWLNQIWPHIMAGTTLIHWTCFLTGNATQLTNTNMYLAQHPSVPGARFAYLEQVALGFLIGLAYFLLQGSAAGPCTLALNPACDLGARLCHSFLPIANKGRSGWSYAWVPLFFPFVGSFLGSALMYMGMWSKMYFPFNPYGQMPSWY